MNRAVDSSQRDLHALVRTSEAMLRSAANPPPVDTIAAFTKDALLCSRDGLRVRCTSAMAVVAGSMALR